LQYANDTMLLIQNKEKSILNLKLLLYCFENISGMKINYHKNKVYVFGGDKQSRLDIATKFNCKLGCLLLIYLGILKHHHKLRKARPTRGQCQDDQKDISLVGEINVILGHVDTGKL
jgi:hypothetical protein